MDVVSRDGLKRASGVDVTERRPGAFYVGHLVFGESDFFGEIAQREASQAAKLRKASCYLTFHLGITGHFESRHGGIISAEIFCGNS